MLLATTQLLERTYNKLHTSIRWHVKNRFSSSTSHLAGRFFRKKKNCIKALIGTSKVSDWINQVLVLKKTSNENVMLMRKSVKMFQIKVSFKIKWFI